jgi:hypothetical protein
VIQATLENKEGTNTVTPPPTVALFTTAPAAVTVAVGVNASFLVGGGTPQYYASSSNIAVATAAISGGNLVITGISSGTAIITLADSAGVTKTINVTVAGGSAIGTAPTISPSSITVGDCTTNIPFTIAGGTPPFTIYTSDNVNVPVSAAQPFGSGYVFTASVGPLGGFLSYPGATLTVLDGQSRTATTQVTTGGAYHNTCPNNALLQTVPATANAHVTQTLTFQITGGVPPYTVTSGSATVATVAMSGATSFNATAISVGSALLTVHSADGQNANVTFSVIP